MSERGGRVASWIKLVDNREIYAIDLDRISTFSSAPNGKITFWLPDSGTPIILSPQSHPESYQQVQDYLRQLTGYCLGTHWLKFTYDRSEYLVDLNRISSFSCDPSNKKLAFWLPDNQTKIVLHPQADIDAYHQVLEYIEITTGYSLI